MEALAQAVMIQINALNIPLPAEQPLGTMVLDKNCPDFDCPVCWNSITEGEKKVKTSCNHTLCADCVPNLQSLQGIHNCVACPMCRTRLQKFTVPELQVPLRKVPLNKIRQRLQQQNQLVAMHQYNINQAPNRIAYHIQRIHATIANQENSERELGAALAYQSALQEEINMRARPRGQQL
jgi:zinc-RING finger domain